MKKVSVLLLVGVAMAVAAQSRAMCSHHAERSIQPISAQGIARVVIHAGAGKLNVHGSSSNAIAASGTACAGNDEDLERLQLTSRRDGDALVIESATSGESWHWFGGGNGWLDTEVTVPNGVAIEIQDGSGDIEVIGTGAVEIDDGSGDIVIKNVSGKTVLHDGSGEIELSNVRGDVELRDDSGGIRANDIHGSLNIPSDGSGEIVVRGVDGGVRIESDGSGGIDIDQVARSVYIGDDGSGEIKIANVRGDVAIDGDGSGGIDVEDVDGNLRVGPNGSGGVRHERVRGQVEVRN
jgi:hypothetical protein